MPRSDRFFRAAGLVVLAMTVSCLVSPPVSAGTPVKPGRVAFLGITLIDTSTEGDYYGRNQAEAERIALIESAVARRFVEEGFELVDIAPVAEELEQTTNPASCNDCDLRMATRLGADYVLVGEVQKVSNLILLINLVLREVPEGTMLRARSVDIRGNNDLSWMRGIRYLMKRHFFVASGTDR